MTAAAHNASEELRKIFPGGWMQAVKALIHFGVHDGWIRPRMVGTVNFAAPIEWCAIDYLIQEHGYGYDPLPLTKRK